MQNIQDLLAKRQVVKPRSVVITSRYFWRKWRPILGNSLAVLIIEARQRCYRNLQSGEVRNWFYATMKELGQTAGFSSKKIASLLKKPHAQKFIRFKPTYIYNPDLGKRIKGKCLFQVILDDPLTPDDELQFIGQEIHKGVSNPSQPKGQGEDEGESFEEQPSGEKVCNNYSTISELNKDNIYNTTITRSIKGEQVQVIDHNFNSTQEALMSRRKQYQHPDIYDPIYLEICQLLGADSILLRTVLQSCFIGEMRIEEDLAIVSFDAPNRYYQQVIDSRLKQRIIHLLENKLQRKITLTIVHQEAEITE